MISSSTNSRRLPSAFNQSMRAALLTAFFVTALAILTFGVKTNVLAQTVRSNSKAPATDSGLAAIKQFVNRDTLLVARLDLSRVDYQKLSVTFESLFSQTLDLANLPKESKDACCAEFHKTAIALADALKESNGSLQESYGTTVCYYVMQTPRADGECFIIPINGVEPAKVEKLKTLAQRLKLSCAVYQKEYLIASQTPLKEIGSFYKSFTPATNKQLEDFFKSHSDKAFAVRFGRIKIRPLFHASQQDDGAKTARVRQYDPFSNSPRSVKDIVELIDSTLVDGFAYFDASDLRLYAKLKFSAPINAGSCRDKLSDAFDEFNAYYFKLLEASSKSAKINKYAPGASLTYFSDKVLEKYHMYSWVRELYAGNLNQLLPTQEGADLVLDVSALGELKKIGCNTLTVSYFANDQVKMAAQLVERATKIAEEDESAINPFVPALKSYESSDESTAVGSNPFEEFLTDADFNDQDSNAESADSKSNPFDEFLVEDGSEDQESEDSQQTQETQSDDEDEIEFDQ